MKSRNHHQNSTTLHLQPVCNDTVYLLHEAAIQIILHIQQIQLPHNQISASVSSPVSNSPIISQPWSAVNLQQACTYLNATGSSSKQLIIIAFSDFVILLFIFNQKRNNMFWWKRIKHGAMQIFSLLYRAPDWAQHKN